MIYGLRFTLRTGYDAETERIFTLRTTSSRCVRWHTVANLSPIQSTTQHFKVDVLSNGVTTQLSNAVTL